MQEFCGSAFQNQGHIFCQHPVFSLFANTAYVDIVPILAMMQYIFKKKKISPVMRISDKEEQVRYYFLTK